MTAVYRLAPHAGLVHEEGPPPCVYLADLRTGPVLTLPGTAAVILLVALDMDAAQVPSEVARLTGAEVDTVRPHVARHLAALADRGLIRIDAR